MTQIFSLFPERQLHSVVHSDLNAFPPVILPIMREPSYNWHHICPTRTISWTQSWVPFLHKCRGRSVGWIFISGGKGLIPSLC